MPLAGADVREGVYPKVTQLADKGHGRQGIPKLRAHLLYVCDADTQRIIKGPNLLELGYDDGSGLPGNRRDYGGTTPEPSSGVMHDGIQSIALFKKSLC